MFASHSSNAQNARKSGSEKNAFQNSTDILTPSSKTGISTTSSAMMIEEAVIERCVSVIECLRKLYHSSIRQRLRQLHLGSLLTLTLMQCVAGEEDRHSWTAAGEEIRPLPFMLQNTDNVARMVRRNPSANRVKRQCTRMNTVLNITVTVNHFLRVHDRNEVHQKAFTLNNEELPLHISSLSRIYGIWRKRQCTSCSLHFV